MNYKNKNILVIGLGTSGKSAVEFFIDKGANVFVYDDNKQAVKEMINIYLVNELTLNDKAIFNSLELAILSPGVSIYHEIVKQCQLFGIKVISELELGVNNINGKILAITGSNGKTTTVSLLKHILTTAGKKCILAGNIGSPLTSFASPVKKTYILEVSSFQLESANIKPNISAILNLSENHLDRHFSFREYAETKCKIFSNQTKKDILVLNADDEYLKKFDEKNIKPKIIWFSAKSIINGMCVINENICLKNKNIIKRICPVSSLFLKGEHNLSNALCAITFAIKMGIKPKYIELALKTFKGVEHRIEFVKQIKGIEFFNDSKSTTARATEISVSSFIKPIILILGGSDKGINYDEMVKKIGGKIKLAILTGQISEKLKNSFDKNLMINYIVKKDFFEALATAYEKAESGDVVLLSPATASFDCFRNFEERGKAFKSFVEGINEE